GSTTRPSSRAAGSAWPPWRGSCAATAAGSGPTAVPARARRSTSRWLASGQADREEQRLVVVLAAAEARDPLLGLGRAQPGREIAGRVVRAGRGLDQVRPAQPRIAAHHQLDAVGLELAVHERDPADDRVGAGGRGAREHLVLVVLVEEDRRGGVE